MKPFGLHSIEFVTLTVWLANLASCSKVEPSEGTPEIQQAEFGSTAPPVETARDKATDVRAVSQVTRGSLCERVCESSAVLGCRRAPLCKQNCLAMASSAACGGPVKAFFECLASQAPAHWECLEDGTGAIREGFCEQEQAAFAACLQRSPSH